MWSLPHVLPVPPCSVDSENGGGAQAEARKLFWWSLVTWTNLGWCNNAFGPHSSLKYHHVHSAVGSSRLLFWFWGQNLLFIFPKVYTFISIFICKFEWNNKKYFTFIFTILLLLAEIVLVPFFFFLQNKIVRIHFNVITVCFCKFMGFVTLLWNVDCDDCPARNPAFSVS